MISHSDGNARQIYGSIINSWVVDKYMSNCRLCNQPKKLVDSHIFPEFMYEPLYDDEHRFKIISMKDGDIIKEPQKGIYEKLMCDECDNKIIGSYEDHASKIIFSDNKKTVDSIRTKYGLLIYGLDYRLFKLFQISLIWRASITTRPEIYKINLGPHAEKMRIMLLNGDPGEVYEYGVILYLFPHSTKEMIDFILPPVKLQKKINGHQVYRAIFNGLVWIFYVSSHLRNFSNKEFFLSREGKLPIVDSGKIGERFIENMANEFDAKEEKDMKFYNKIPPNPLDSK